MAVSVKFHFHSLANAIAEDSPGLGAEAALQPRERVRIIASVCLSRSAHGDPADQGWSWVSSSTETLERLDQPLGVKDSHQRHNSVAALKSCRTMNRNKIIHRHFPMAMVWFAKKEEISVGQKCVLFLNCIFLLIFSHLLFYL